MDIFFTGFILGCISVIAIGIFIWSIRRGKGDSPESIKSRTDRNNISTERGLGSLKTNNIRAGDVTAGGLEAIDNTNRTVSEIIADAKRKRKTDN